MKDTDFRPLSNSESETLNKLLSFDFIGREELLQQLSGLLARQIDENGSLQFQICSQAVSPVQQGPVVEARYCDSDTTETNPISVNILLHLKEGKMWMLEIYKDDSSPVLKKVKLDELELFTQYPHIKPEKINI